MRSVVSDMETRATLQSGRRIAQPGASLSKDRRPTRAGGAESTRPGDFVTTLCDPLLARRSVRVDAQLRDLPAGVLELHLEDAGDGRREEKVIVWPGRMSFMRS